MNKLVALFALITGVLLLNATSFSQNKPVLAPSQDNIDMSQYANTSNFFHVKAMPQRIISPAERDLINQLRDAKVRGDQQRETEIDIQRSQQFGYTSVGVNSQPAGVITPGNQNPPFSGDVNQTLIWTGSVKGLATVTEQVGANIGRIWMAFGHDTTAGIAGGIRWYYSDNGGASWVNYANLGYGGTAHCNADELSMAIVEGASGDKYLWTVNGVNTGGANYQVTLTGLDITTFAGGVITMSWPGNSANIRYYNPRITTDNPSYAQASTYLMITCSQDSVAGTYNENSQRYAEVHAANNVATITPIYAGPGIGWFTGSTPGGLAYHRYLSTDVCYYRNNTSGDSLIVSYSGVPDSTKVFISAMAEATYTTNSATRSSFATNYWQQDGHIYSPGNVVGQNIYIIDRRNFTNGGDWDVYYYKSTNGCITGTAWTSGYVDSYSSTTTVPTSPDVYGKRGVVDLRVAYTYNNTALDSVIYTSSTGGAFVSPVRVSYNDSSPFNAPPKPAFKNGGGDDCFILWSQYDGNNVQSSRLCGSTVGITNNGTQVPHAYNLEQNYPNPFNPSTEIKFGLPSSGLAKMVVYDIEGRVVATLVDKVMDAGSYSVSFDASKISSGIYFYKLTSGNFVSTKKMVLVK